MTSSHHDPSPCQWFFRLDATLDRRSAPRFVNLRDVLEQLTDDPQDRLPENLPDRWPPPKPAEPSSPEGEPAL
jgi:hypothetical protein